VSRCSAASTSTPGIEAVGIRSTAVPNHYDVLGVAPDAAPEELRRAYLGLARRLHPDRVASTTMAAADADRSARRMQEVNAAWGVLGDPLRRADYDRMMARVAAEAPPPSSQRHALDDLDDLDDLDLDDLDLDTPIPHPLAAPGDIGLQLVRIAPWLVLAAILVGIYVFTAFARPDRPAADPQHLLDRCVLIDASSTVGAVPCDEPNDGRVERVVSTSAACPLGSTARRQDSSWLCLVPADPATAPTDP
jgi:DnaJ-domain-containing protein 1